MTETLCNSLKVNPDTVRPVEGLTERRIRWKNPGNELRSVANHGPRPNYRSELPVFPGENPWNWERKCETYFTMNLVPDNLRTELASMNLVGEADNWYYGFRLEHGTRPWLNFVGALYQRFEDRSVSGFCGQFKNMYQTGTVKEYLSRFSNLKTQRAPATMERAYSE
jgi:hypothetical protein